MSFLPVVVPRLQAQVLEWPIVKANQRVSALLSHPAGPFTIHFWAPSFKWGISIANIADMRKDPRLLSTPQQTAVAATGLIWSRYSTQIVPVNYNLLSVNIFMAATGLYQLYRIATFEPPEDAAAGAGAASAAGPAAPAQSATAAAATDSTAA